MRLNLTMMVVVQVSSEAQFEYAWCLVRSKYPADIRKGIILLEDLFQVAFPRCDNILMLLSMWVHAMNLIKSFSRTETTQINETTSTI